MYQEKSGKMDKIPALSSSTVEFGLTVTGMGPLHDDLSSTNMFKLEDSQKDCQQ
jgi:hypothetical protein